VVLAPDGDLGASHLPSVSRGARPSATPEVMALGLTLEEATRRYIAATVEACDGNRSEAAKQLGIGRNTITRALARPVAARTKPR